ncbi:unnamed protein product [Effrenium voratum]|uniref:Thioredoxin domain-containing protein n=1 Tax=Effrenium voratum TaxID=2562239 RepID=A0AA36HKA9_9DINO|nr:unnamed protein product [Effrenium voratum]
MLPQVAIKSWYHSYDAFRKVPADLSEASTSGALMTLLAVCTCAVLFFCETSAFLTDTPTSRIVVDTNQDELLKINFDLTMLDMDCAHLTVGVWDAFGTERFNVTRNVQKQRVDQKGSRKGQPYKEEELLELEFSGKSFTAEELAELDSDWGSSSDHFQHNDFQAVVDAHDFAMINFYADWCGHCRDFAPLWLDFEKSVNEGNVATVDADGSPANVHLLRLNCVDFEETCRDQMIRFFPSIRLYRRGAKKGEFEEYNGEKTAEGMTRWLKAAVAKRHLHTGATYHSIFTEGCRVSGFVDVARVPGTLHFQVGNAKDREINPAFTNVSHTVHHLTFGEAPRGLRSALPSEYRRHVNPLDGRTFTVDKFHKAPSHFIKVVHTRFEDSGLRSYQQTHQWSVRTLQRGTTPQAKFSYDLAPVEVVVAKAERHWYDYVTQIFAITGGAFTVMSLLAGLLKLSSAQLKSMLDKMN